MPISFKPPKAPKGIDICTKCYQKKEGNYYGHISEKAFDSIFICKDCMLKRIEKTEKRMKSLGYKIIRQKELDDFK